MVEQKSVDDVRSRAVFGGRSPLLMPVMKGNTLETDDVAEFLKSRLEQSTSVWPPINGANPLKSINFPAFDRPR